MKTLDTLTKDERSTLLYVESCAVDYAGRVNPARLNADDFKILNKWTEERFIDFGRIKEADCNRDGSLWVVLSDEAFTLAAAERKARAHRRWAKRGFQED